MMKPRLLVSVCSCLVLVLALPGPTSADPINVTSGQLIVTGRFGEFELFGDRGLAFSGRVDAEFGIFMPRFQCNNTPNCVPGSSVSLRAFWSGSDIRSGVVSFDGRTYPVTDNGGAAAALEFSGFFVAPPLASSAVLTAPFQLVPGTATNFASFFTFPFPDSEFQFLAGTGTATITLSQGSGPMFPDSWSVNSVRYDFSPVPEPGTLLMVGLGMAGIARRVSRRRRGV